MIEIAADDPLSVFKDGVNAGLLGTDPRACPWNAMTREWHEWQRGQTWGVKLQGSETKQ